jgi:DNA repair exonuclease SbcCD ATPase subunit
VYIEFKKIKFSNILSFGSVPVEIEFKKGLNLITGKNGCGKSTILDALSFCLYGKPYRSILIYKLLNRKNKKNLKVEIIFKKDKKDTYKIIRQLKPNNFEIYKNDEKMDLLSAKKLNQEEIDKIIGINYKIFKQVISLAITHNKPFVSLSLQEKREIIEQIFNLQIFGQMLKNIKKIQSDLKIQIQLLKKELDLLKEWLTSSREQLKKIKLLKKNFQKNKKDDIDCINLKIKELENKTVDSCENLKKVEIEMEISTCELEKIKNLDFLREQFTELNNQIIQKKFIIENNNKIIQTLKENQICPTCKVVLNEEHKIEEINYLQKNNNDIYTEIENLNTLSDQLEDEYKKTFQHKKQIDDDLNKNNLVLSSLKKDLENYNQQILQYVDEKEKIENKEFEIDIDDLMNKFNEKLKNYKIIYQELLKDQNIFQDNNIITDILSESGIKSFFFKKLLPILNLKINQYIKIFNLPVKFEFNELMEEKIYDLDNLNEENCYESYSEGEKKRIDIAILLSFISMPKLISNWHCNLLMIDELLDGAMDDDGLEKLVDNVKTMTNEIECIYVISHRIQLEYDSQFSNHIMIEKNIFSKIK